MLLQAARNKSEKKKTEIRTIVYHLVMQRNDIFFDSIVCLRYFLVGRHFPIYTRYIRNLPEEKEIYFFSLKALGCGAVEAIAKFISCFFEKCLRVCEISYIFAAAYKEIATG